MSATTSTQTDVGGTIAEERDIANYDLLAGQTVAQITAVRIFDIGQGDCSGLLDENDAVFLYVDYGGLLDHPDKGNFSNVANRLPIASDKTVVLTHWDWDHYNSARHNAAATTAQWLVPRQNIGPRALAFTQGLAKSVCWPESIGRAAIRYAVGSDHDVQIEKCGPRPKGLNQPEDRNLTGLAVTVIEKDAQGVDGRFVLLPGDAPYHKIPSRVAAPPPGGDCLGLLAYHHGAHSHWIRATDTALPGYGGVALRMAYSFGKSNSYGHPDRKKYQPSGWDVVGLESPDLRASSPTRDHEDIRF